MEKLFTINYSLFTKNGEFEYLTNQYLFAELNYHPDYINLGENDDDKYADFYSNYSGTNMMQLLQVQNNIDTGDINTAIMLNSSIEADNGIEKNRLLVNDVYLRALSDTNYENGYTKENIDYLLKVSNLNSDYNGDGVYSAWVLLGIDPDNIQKRSKQYPVSNSDTNNMGNFSVFPNPANENIVIAYSGDIALLQKCEIEFYDVYGKLIKKLILNQSMQSINISDLSQGIYIYHIINYSKILKTDKLIKM